MASSARIDELKKKFDENPRRYFAPLANEYRKGGDADQAIAICREFLPQQPGHMSGHIVYGQALFDAGQFEEAKTVFDTALTLDPENLIALRSLGDIARNLGDVPVARSWYQRVLDADPRNDEIAAIITELAAGGAAEPARVEPASQAGPTGTVVMGAISLADLVKPEPAAAVEPGPEAVEIAEVASAPAAAVELESVSGPEPEPEPVAEIRAEPEPPTDSSSEELLDIDELRIEPETPTVPRVSMPRAALADLGFEVDRADDESFVPSAEPAVAPAEAPRDPFATETMAELYLTQGHTDDALRVYRQLLAQRPGDATIESRITTILAMTALTPALPMAAIPAESDAQVESGFELDDELATAPAVEPEIAWAVEAETAVEPEAEIAIQSEVESVQRVPDLDASGFGIESESAPSALADDMEMVALEPAPAARTSGGMRAPAGGPSIREFLSAFADRTPATNGATPPEPAASISTVPAVESFAAAAELPRTSATYGGSIDTLFGSAAVSAGDSAAAATLAGAYGVVDDQPAAPTSMSGAPARRATEELSLDTVFREPLATPTPDSAGFSFDKFFAGGAPASGTSANETPAESQPPESADADIQQFNSWLDGLKKR